MNSKFRGVALLLTLLMLIVGCGGGSTPSTPTPTPTPTPAPGTPAPAAPKGLAINGEFVATDELIAAAEREGKVTMYTSGAAADEQLVMNEFMKRFPKIQVEVVRATGGQLYERYMTEFQNNRLVADVVMMSDIALMNRLVVDKAVEEYLPPSDDKFPEGTKKKGLYYTVTMPVMYFIYNSQLIKPADAPKSWADLLDPKWKGKIGMTPAPIGGTAWTLAYFHRTVLGEDYWAKLAAQNPAQHTGGAGLAESVARGETPIGILADVTDFQLRVRLGAPITPVFATEGVPVVVYTLALAKNAPKPNAARLLYSWYLSKEGQAAIMGVRGGFSARTDGATPEGKPDPASVKLYVPSIDKLISLRDEWVGEWVKVFKYN